MRPATFLLLALVTVGCAAHRQTSTGPARVKLELARQLAARGERDAAFEAADEACRALPRDGAARALRGALLSDRGLLDEAEADLRDAVQLAPELAEAHSALAVVHERRSRVDDAEREHRRAVELAPGDARYLNNLGYALLLHNKPTQALPVLLDAARAKPLDRRIRTNLGFAYAAVSDYPRARQAFELGGTAAEAQNNLGLAYERAGNLAQARSHYEDALRLDPQLGVARENLARIVNSSMQRSSVGTASGPEQPPTVAQSTAPVPGAQP